MKLSWRKGAVSLAVLLAAGSLAWGAGMWPDLPIVGQGSYSIGTGTVPAGPSGLTGSEVVPMDTRSASGAQPQTVLVPSGVLGGAGIIYQGSYTDPKNMLRNGDISVNPFQSGTSQAADITNTVTTAADGFRVQGGASSAINWSKQTGASDIVANQFVASLRFQRKNLNANTAKICQAFILDSSESVALQGQTFVYSFWAKAGANLSPAQGAITVNVDWGTGSNDTTANFIAGSWAGVTHGVAASGSSNSSFPTTVASGVATLNILPTGQSATWVQYWVSGTIGATATQVGTEICMTPVGTAGANDWFETSNQQLEIVAPNVITPSAFEHQTPSAAVAKAQRNLYVITEGAAATLRGFGHVTTAGAGDGNGKLQWLIKFPQVMRAVPTVTYAAGFAGFTTTAETTATACSALATDATLGTMAASTELTVAQCSLTSSTIAVGLSMTIVDNGGSGKVTASSEL